MKDNLDLQIELDVLSGDLEKINKDLENRTRIRDQLEGKLELLMERLLNEYGLPSVDVALEKLEVLKCEIKTLSIECGDKLTELKEKIRKFDERATKVDRE